MNRALPFIILCLWATKSLAFLPPMPPEGDEWAKEMDLVIRGIVVEDLGYHIFDGPLRMGPNYSKVVSIKATHLWKGNLPKNNVIELHEYRMGPLPQSTKSRNPIPAGAHVFVAAENMIDNRYHTRFYGFAFYDAPSTYKAEHVKNALIKVKKYWGKGKSLNH